MSKDAKQVKEIIKREKLVPILRIQSPEAVLDIASAVVKAGGKVIEFTMTTRNIMNEITRVKEKYPDLTIGLGTVYEKKDADLALKSGADFIVAPTLNYDIVDTVKSQDKLIMLSGFTPTEIYNAYKAGSDMIKLFPASEMSPSFIREIQGPMPFIEIFPTGGLNLITAIQFLSYGAVAVGMGNTVFKKGLIENGNFDEITAILSNAIRRIQNMEI